MLKKGYFQINELDVSSVSPVLSTAIPHLLDECVIPLPLFQSVNLVYY